jgi:N-glycosylase/DNA lyase
MYSINVPFINLDQIYKSGQVFTWMRCSDGKYVIPYKDKVVKVQQRGEHLFFSCTEEDFYDYWWDYFDLERDYSRLNFGYKSIDEEIKFKMNRCKGLHILRQDLFEVIIFSVLETATSIERVKQMIAGITEKCGKRHTNSMREVGMVRWYEFPTPERILKSKNKLTSKDIGYKMDIIIDICQAIVDGWLDLNLLRIMDTEDAIEYLMEFKGIGRKVAESICLFGLHRFDVFPIDTHMKQFFSKEYKMEPEEWLDENIYGTKYHRYMGYLRQIIFYSEIHPPIGYEEYGDEDKRKRGKKQ